jgi:serine/threonine protein kinase
VYADDVRLAALAESLTDSRDPLLQALESQETAADPADDRFSKRMLELLKASAKDETAQLQLAETPSGLGVFSATLDSLQLPLQLEHYRPLRVIGQGGMGKVLLAEDTRLGRLVAVKTLRAELAAIPQARERFLREARTAASLEHDHLVPIYHVGEADGVPFLAMPLLKGETLDALLRRTGKPLPPLQAARIAREVAEGLSAAHELRLIHRDVKPSNIWLEAPHGRVKILDFGLAKAHDVSETEFDPNLTATGAIVGTPAYMAPEQGAGSAIDGRSDLFSLGCVLYEMLCGRRAFDGPNTMSILTSLALHTPPAPHTLDHNCPEVLSQLAMQLLQKDPTARPVSARAVVDALKAFEAMGSPDAPKDASRKTAVGDVPSVHSAKPAASGGAAALSGQRPWSRTVLVALGLLLAGAASYGVIQITTDRGTYIIETDDPGFSFRVSQGAVILEDSRTRRTYDLRIVSQDRAKGQFELEVADRDAALVFKTPTLTIQRGEQVALTASIQQKPPVGANSSAPIVEAPVKPASPVEPRSEDPEREAARYVMEIGGAILVNEYTNVMRRGAELPAGPIQLTYVFLRMNDQVDDAAVAIFKPCRHLEVIHLEFTRVTDAGLVNFRECRKLHSVNLSGPRVTDIGLANFSDCENLTELRLIDTGVTNAGLPALKGRRNLRELAIQKALMTDDGLASLSECENLVQLALHQMPLTDVGLDHVKSLRKLKVLNVSMTQISDRGLRRLRESPDLERLDLEGLKLTKEGLDSFNGCQKLGFLKLSETDVDDDAISSLKGHSKLLTLILSGTQVSDAGVDTLQECGSLVELVLYRTRVTAAGIDRLKKALPRCRIEWDEGVVAPPTD